MNMDIDGQYILEVGEIVGGLILGGEIQLIPFQGMGDTTNPVIKKILRAYRIEDMERIQKTERLLMGAITEMQKQAILYAYSIGKPPYSGLDMLTKVRILRAASFDLDATRIIMENEIVMDEEDITEEMRASLARMKKRAGLSHDRPLALELYEMIEARDIDTITNAIITFHDAITRIPDFGDKTARDNVRLFEREIVHFGETIDELLRIDRLVSAAREGELRNVTFYMRFFRRFHQRVRAEIVPRLRRILTHFLAVSPTTNIAHHHDVEQFLIIYRRLAPLKYYTSVEIP